jgi:four helix bundle protein
VPPCTDLAAWHDARQLTALSHRAIARLPSAERHVLGDPWRRAAYRAVLHIAEGARVLGTRDGRRHLAIARASLSEISAIIELAVGLEYLRRVEIVSLEAARAACARRVCGLLRTADATAR